MIAIDNAESIIQFHRYQWFLKFSRLSKMSHSIVIPRGIIVLCCAISDIACHPNNNLLGIAAEGIKCDVTLFKIPGDIFPPRQRPPAENGAPSVVAYIFGRWPTRIGSPVRERQ